MVEFVPTKINDRRIRFGIFILGWWLHGFAFVKWGLSRMPRILYGKVTGQKPPI